MSNVTPLTPQGEPLEDLAAAYLEAKKQEELARIHRVEIEKALIARVGIKEEGSQTTTAGGFKITTTGKLNRKVDWARYEREVRALIPEALRPVDYKPSLNTRGIKYVENNEPEIYKLMTRCMTTEPAKPAVAVQRID